MGFKSLLNKCGNLKNQSVNSHARTCSVEYHSTFKFQVHSLGIPLGYDIWSRMMKVFTSSRLMRYRKSVLSACKTAYKNENICYIKFVRRMSATSQTHLGTEIVTLSDGYEYIPNLSSRRYMFHAFHFSQYIFIYPGSSWICPQANMHALLMVVQLCLWEILLLWSQQFARISYRPTLHSFHSSWTIDKKQLQLLAYQLISYGENLDQPNTKFSQAESSIGP